MTIPAQKDLNPSPPPPNSHPDVIHKENSKVPFPVSSWMESERWLNGFKLRSHKSVRHNLEIHYGVSYLCRQRRESAPLCSSCGVTSPSGAKSTCYQPVPTETGLRLRWRRMFPSLGSMRYSDEVLKTSLTCPGWHFSSEEKGAFTFIF